MKIIPYKKGMTPEAGKCYSGMPNKTYHDFKEWISSTGLKDVGRSVEYYNWKKTQPRKNTIAFERGGALHSAMEGLIDNGTLDLFHEQVKECEGKGMDTNKWKEVKKVFPDCYILPEHEFENVKTMARNCFDKWGEIGIFGNGRSEFSFFWIDPKTQFRCKCRPDWLRITPKNELIIDDYKTSKNHQLAEFEKDIAKLGYHFSAAFYREGVFRVWDVRADSFNHLVSANTPPFECAYYELQPASIEEGRLQFRKALDDIKEYDPKKKLEKGYSNIPRWGHKLLPT